MMWVVRLLVGTVLVVGGVFLGGWLVTQRDTCLAWALPGMPRQVWRLPGTQPIEPTQGPTTL